MNTIILIIASYLFKTINALPIISSPYLLGAYQLRRTNDKMLNTKYAYLILNDDNNIKLKTIIQNGILATKVSKTGRIEYDTNFKNTFSTIFGIRDYDIIVRFNNVNKYSYSILGIEFPEFRYKQIANYNIEKKVNVRYKDNTLYIKDDDMDKYYLFDLHSSISTTRLPYIEISFNTLIITQIINIVGIIIHLFIHKYINIDNEVISLL